MLPCVQQVVVALTILCICVLFCRTAWLSYYKIFKMPVLVALNPADTARAMEAQSDKQVVQEALKVRSCRAEDLRVIECISPMACHHGFGMMGWALCTVLG